MKGMYVVLETEEGERIEVYDNIFIIKNAVFDRADIIDAIKVQDDIFFNI